MPDDSIRFECACGKRILARAESAGKRVKCPACGKPATVPAATFPDFEPEASELDRIDAAVAGQPVSVRPPGAPALTVEILPTREGYLAARAVAYALRFMGHGLAAMVIVAAVARLLGDRPDAREAMLVAAPLAALFALLVEAAYQASIVLFDIERNTRRQNELSELAVQVAVRIHNDRKPAGLP